MCRVLWKLLFLLGWAQPLPDPTPSWPVPLNWPTPLAEILDTPQYTGGHRKNNIIWWPTSANLRPKAGNTTPTPQPYYTTFRNVMWLRCRCGVRQQSTTATRYTMTATAMNMWKTNDVLLRNRQTHDIVGHISPSSVFGCHCLWPSLSNHVVPSLWMKVGTCEPPSVLVSDDVGKCLKHTRWICEDSMSRVCNYCNIYSALFHCYIFYVERRLMHASDWDDIEYLVIGTSGATSTLCNKKRFYGFLLCI